MMFKEQVRVVYGDLIQKEGDKEGSVLSGQEEPFWDRGNVLFSEQGSHYRIV